VKPAVFLDRDGTLIEEVGYLDRLDRLEIFPWSVDAVRLLARAGFATVVVTNQAGVARGFFTEDFVRETHRHLAERFAAGGVRFDGFYYCPHHPEAPLREYREDCACRKPKPGMLSQAAADLGLDLARSYVVGDRLLDVDMATAAGARGVLVLTGYGVVDAARLDTATRPAFVAANLMEATAWILGEQARCA